jgi:hypothetical protein
MVKKTALHRTAVMQRLLEGTEDEVHMRPPRHPSANNAAGEDINDKGHLYKALPGRRIGEVRHPQGIRVWRPELPVHLVRWAGRGLVGDRSPGLLAADDATQAHPPHQAFHRAAGYHGAFPAKLPPDLADALDPKGGRMHPPDLLHAHEILPGARRGPRRIGTLRDMGMVGRRSDPQHPADRLDPVGTSMIVDKGDQGFERRSSFAIAKYADALRRISLA